MTPQQAIEINPDLASTRIPVELLSAYAHETVPPLSA
jgi:hypothetical protein